VLIVSAWTRLMLAEIFLRAFWIHQADRTRFRVALASFGLPSDKKATVFALGVDLAIAASLLVDPRIGGVSALAFLLTVTSLGLVQRLRNRTIADCGCSARVEAVDGRFFLRNTALALASIPVLLTPSPDVFSAVTAVCLFGLSVGMRRMLATMMRVAPGRPLSKRGITGSHVT
jgi:hypothetical protein